MIFPPCVRPFDCLRPPYQKLLVMQPEITLFFSVSSGGYLTVQEPPWRTPLATAYVEGGVEMGFENR